MAFPGSLKATKMKTEQRLENREKRNSSWVSQREGLVGTRYGESKSGKGKTARRGETSWTVYNREKVVMSNEKVSNGRGRDFNTKDKARNAKQA